PPGRPAARPRHAGARPLPRHLGRDPARARPPRRRAAGAPPLARLPHADAAVGRHVPRRRRRRGRLAAGGKADRGRAVRAAFARRAPRSGRGGRTARGVLRLTLYVESVHEGGFTVFVEEAREDSADLLFMPEATASDWATIFSHAEVRRIDAG